MRYLYLALLLLCACGDNNDTTVILQPSPSSTPVVSYPPNSGRVVFDISQCNCGSCFYHRLYVGYNSWSATNATLDSTINSYSTQEYHEVFLEQGQYTYVYRIWSNCSDACCFYSSGAGLKADIAGQFSVTAGQTDTVFINQ
jgi:hypothetical protein